VERHVTFDRLYNFRDLGGYPAADGQRVVWCRVYRSDSLSKLDGADWDRFRALGIRTVIDLRHACEVEARGRVPYSDELSYHHLSIEHRPYDQAGLGPEVDPVRFLADRYAEVAKDGVVELRQALELIAFGDGPIAFHCASGKDRTGLLAALLLSLVGVADEDIAADFALTGRATGRFIAEYQALTGQLPRWPGFATAPPELVRLVLGELAAEYGSVQGYAVDRLGLGGNLIAALRTRLLEHA
jgi:protein-tyrosine phosphatase